MNDTMHKLREMYPDTSLLEAIETLMKKNDALIEQLKKYKNEAADAKAMARAFDRRYCEILVEKRILTTENKLLKSSHRLHEEVSDELAELLDKKYGFDGGVYCKDDPWWEENK